MAASICASDPAAAPIVALEDYGWTPPGASRPALVDVTLQLAAGECVLLTGPTGAGKSTLLRAIAGALPAGGASRGRRTVTGRAALLFQEVETQLLFSTVDEEVASGLRGAADAAERARRSTAALAAAGLGDLAGRPVEDLSAGERQRVVLAALLAGHPSLLLLDEPSSALDPDERGRLVTALAALRARGHALVIAEHVTAPFRALADRSLRLEDGRVVAPPATARTRPTRPIAPLAAGSGSLLVRARAIEVRDAGGRSLLPATDLCIHRGERVLVCGANGSGKSTLLRALAGLAPVSPGQLSLSPTLAPGGSGAPRPAPGRVSLVLQSPPRNLFAQSVGEEIAFTLRRSGWAADRSQRRVRELLDACGLAPFRARSPLRLSFGEQHRVAIAAALAPEPALLLLDEPFSGLDGPSRERLLALLDREQARTAMAVLIASHDGEELAGWAQRRIPLRPLRTLPPSASDAGRGRERAATAGRGCHYRETGSPLHRLGVGWKLSAVALGSAAAVAARTPAALLLLLATWALGYRAARLSPAELWQDTRWLLAQGAVVVALSALSGGAEGAWTGLRAAGQIALFFLPGALLLRTSKAGGLLAAVRRILPPRLSFALATSLRFVPFFARELEEITAVQRLRGARLSLRELWRPSAWRDAVECAGVPLAVRAIHTAGEVALAAEVRGVATGETSA